MTDQYPIRIVRDESIQGTDRQYHCYLCKANFKSPGIRVHNKICNARIDDGQRYILAWVGLESLEYKSAEKITFDDWCDLMKIDSPLREALHHLCMSKQVQNDNVVQSVLFWKLCMRELMTR